ncbi:ThuA domain-containing protein [Mucilaginibacter sp. BJC16-A38]|uniref:ThuA domain-containing protein n=1 Tax=Mucilaginibacter phenanthrenivorans TaxID=1234842 RepID=UPI002157AA73|nr:ThuA domain-containing protein [Mucilaginibacter phenanthrenivorans]MCR8558919.1 ThuA domain-containing protein [Mucilaginibacter phenanthrenivorans]
MKKLAVLIAFYLFIAGSKNLVAQTAQRPRFKAIAIAEIGGGHAKFDVAAKVWLTKLAADSNFTIDYISDTKQINKDFLKQYQLFIQLDYPPYPWEKDAQDAFEDYIENGRGGWVGFHHPTLLGVFDGYPMWQWYSGFMGGIEFKLHIPGGTDAKLTVEDRTHPAMKGIAPTFITKDEWYIYNKSPRPNVRVIASIDETTYNPAKDVKMGDHPVIWTNEHVKAKNIYIAMGHFPELFDDINFTTLIRNSIFWAAK